MTEEMQNLGRRAVACKGWKWMPGMRCAFNEYEAWEYQRLVGPTEGDGFVQASEVAIPDLADAATVGCLLALVRAAYSLADVHVRPCAFMRRWVVMSDEDELAGSLDNEAAALVAALEAAP